MKKQIKKGFTLAEVLITLTVLGVIAAIVIPTMLKNNGEAAKRTKMKKAIASYEKVVENMRLTEGYTTVDAMKTDMNVEGCDKSRGYFKTKKVDSADGCKFQTNDGLWWYIKNIEKPIVAFEEDNLTEAKANGDTNEAFYLTLTQGTAAQGYAFIVNDPSGAANKALVYAKLAEGKKDPYAAYSQKCSCSYEDLQELTGEIGLKSTECNSCTATYEEDGATAKIILDGQGRPIYVGEFVSEDDMTASGEMEISFNDAGGYTYSYKQCEGTECWINTEAIDSQGRTTLDKTCGNYEGKPYCDIEETVYNGKAFERTFQICLDGACRIDEKTVADSNGFLSYKDSYTEEGKVASSNVYINDGSKVTYKYENCNAEHSSCGNRYQITSWDDDGNPKSWSWDDYICPMSDPLCLQEK